MAAQQDTKFAAGVLAELTGIRAEGLAHGGIETKAQGFVKVAFVPCSHMSEPGLFRVNGGSLLTLNQAVQAVCGVFGVKFTSQAGM